MKLLKWLVFLPILFVGIAIAQIIGLYITENESWYSAIFPLMFLGSALAMGIVGTLMLPTDKKVAATIALTLFIPFELYWLWTMKGTVSILSLLGRLYLDTVVVLVSIGYATVQEKREADSQAVLR